MKGGGFRISENLCHIVWSCYVMHGTAKYSMMDERCWRSSIRCEKTKGNVSHFSLTPLLLYLACLFVCLYFFWYYITKAGAVNSTLNLRTNTTTIVYGPMEGMMKGVTVTIDRTTNVTLLLLLLYTHHTHMQHTQLYGPDEGKLDVAGCCC